MHKRTVPVAGSDSRGGELLKVWSRMREPPEAESAIIAKLRAALYSAGRKPDRKPDGRPRGDGNALHVLANTDRLPRWLQDAAVKAVGKDACLLDFDAIKASLGERDTAGRTPMSISMRQTRPVHPDMDMLRWVERRVDDWPVVQTEVCTDADEVCVELDLGIFNGAGSDVDVFDPAYKRYTMDAAAAAHRRRLLVFIGRMLKGAIDHDDYDAVRALALSRHLAEAFHVAFPEDAHGPLHAAMARALSHAKPSPTDMWIPARIAHALTPTTDDILRIIAARSGLVLREALTSAGSMAFFAKVKAADGAFLTAALQAVVDSHDSPQAVECLEALLEFKHFVPLPLGVALANVRGVVSPAVLDMVRTQLHGAESISRRRVTAQLSALEGPLRALGVDTRQTLTALHAELQELVNALAEHIATTEANVDTVPSDAAILATDARTRDRASSYVAQHRPSTDREQVRQSRRRDRQRHSAARATARRSARISAMPVQASGGRARTFRTV
jgi:hypothetical protein